MPKQFDALTDTQKKDVVKPVRASSTILLRTGRQGPEVLMIKRSKRLRFAPGHSVFPGGKVDAGDDRVSFWRKQLTLRAMPADLPERLAALRELYEEVGIVAGTSTRVNASKFYQYPRLIRSRNIQLNLKKLMPFARWVTPSGSARRFDTSFYLLKAERYFKARYDGGEAVSADWVSPARMIEQLEDDLVKLMIPTRMILSRLASFKTVDDIINNSRKWPVEPILPVRRKTAEGIEIFVKECAGFPQSSFLLQN